MTKSHRSFLEENTWVVRVIRDGKVGEVVESGFSSKSEADARARALGVVPSGNLTLQAIAATNEPFIGLKKHPISIIEVDGKNYARVPFLILGAYKHPKYGTLKFHDDQANEIIDNHVADNYGGSVYLRVGHKKNPALARFDSTNGGFIRTENEHGRTVMVAYGPVTDDELAQREVNLYSLASADLVKFNDNVLYTMDNSFVYENIAMEENVSKPITITIGNVSITLTPDEEGNFSVSSDDVEALKNVEVPEDKSKELEAAQASIVRLEGEVSSRDARITELERSDEDPIEAAKREAREEIMLEVYKEGVKNRERTADFILESALNRIDTDGDTVPAYLVNMIGSLMKLEEFDGKAGKISLESSDDIPVDVRDYLIGWGQQVLNRLPGSIPKSDVQLEKNPNDDPDDVEIDEDLKSEVSKMISAGGLFLSVNPGGKNAVSN